MGNVKEKCSISLGDFQGFSLVLLSMISLLYVYVKCDFSCMRFGFGKDSFPTNVILNHLCLLEFPKNQLIFR